MKFFRDRKFSEFQGAGHVAIDCDKPQNWLLSKDMEIGSGTKRVLLLAATPDDKKKRLQLEMRKCLKRMGKYVRDDLSDCTAYH